MPQAWRTGLLRSGTAKRARRRATRGSLLLILLLVQIALAPIGAEIASDEPSFPSISADHRRSKIPTLLTQNLDGLVFTAPSHDLPAMKRHGGTGAAIVTAVLEPVPRTDLRAWTTPCAEPAGAVACNAHSPRGPPRDMA